MGLNPIPRRDHCLSGKRPMCPGFDPPAEVR